MLATMQRVIAAKRDEAKENDKGFTLIELLVVVLIIGILAAIAIPVFLSQQNSARDAAVESDLGNARIAYASYLVANPSATTVTTANLAEAGFTESEPVTVTVDSSTGDSFCLEGVRDGSDDVWSVTDSRGVERTAC